jgi:hypothetical protein
MLGSTKWLIWCLLCVACPQWKACLAENKRHDTSSIIKIVLNTWANHLNIIQHEPHCIDFLPSYNEINKVSMLIMNSVRISSLGIKSKFNNLVENNRHYSQSIDWTMTTILIWLIKTPMSINWYNIWVPNILPIHSSFIINLTCNPKLSKSSSKLSSTSDPSNQFIIPIYLYCGIELSYVSVILVTSKLSELKQTNVLKFSHQRMSRCKFL